tara:strand:- start:274 stop:564 length:291 start_codon:yes stop_codon:yes gene_type:complete
LEIRCGAGKVDADVKKYVHMLNGTLCANTRVVCCLLENNQTEEGIQLPEALFPFLPVFVEGRPGFVPFVCEPPQEDEDGKKKKPMNKKKSKAKGAE